MKLYGIGHAMVDIFCVDKSRIFDFPPPLHPERIAHIPPEEMSELLTILEKNIPEFSSRCDQSRVSGGTAVNILKTAASLGAECFFSGTVGTITGIRDDDSLFFQKELAHYGVKALLKIADSATGRFLTVVSKNCRASAASPGSARKIAVSQISAEEIKKADWVVIEGMLCLNGPVVEKLSELCGYYGKPLALDAASLFAAEKLLPVVLEWAERIPIVLFANKSEAAALGSFAAGAPTFEELAREITAAKENVVFVEKRAEQGSQLWRRGIKTRCPVTALPALDTTGAGDAFAGGFLTAIHEGKSDFDALAYGNHTAAKVLNCWGCRPSPK